MRSVILFCALTAITASSQEASKPALSIKLMPPDPVPAGTCKEDEYDSENFARLRSSVQRAFIIENEITFLAFPPVANSIVIFGAGYGFKEMRMASWIAQCTVHYWGDIDTHGFAILDQLRDHFEHTESFLMDRSTLVAHEALWGVEESQTVRDLPRLTAAEASLYDEL